MAVKDLPLFKWDQNKIEKYFREISTTERQLFYLKYIEKHINDAYAKHPQIDMDGELRDWDPYLDEVFPDILEFCKRESELLQAAIKVDWTTDDRPQPSGQPSTKNAPSSGRILWKGTRTDLVHLIDTLIKNEFIPVPSHSSVFIAQHFALLEGGEVHEIKTRTVTNTRSDLNAGARTPSERMTDITDDLGKQGRK
jgi:hypothetical protein